MHGILIPVEGDVRPVEFADGWDSIRTMIGADLLERVSVGLPNGHTLRVDEEGRLRNLPINPRASLLYPGITRGVCLHGDVVVVAEGMTDDGPDVVDMPAAAEFAAIYGGRLARELERQPGLMAAVTAHNAGL